MLGTLQLHLLPKFFKHTSISRRLYYTVHGHMESAVQIALNQHLLFEVNITISHRRVCPSVLHRCLCPCWVVSALVHADGRTTLAVITVKGITPFSGGICPILRTLCTPFASRVKPHTSSTSRDSLFCHPFIRTVLYHAAWSGTLYFDTVTVSKP